MIRTVLHHRKTLIQKCLCQYRLKIHMSKMCSSFSNQFNDSQPYIDIENTFHLESHKFRNTLYPDTLSDEILTQLKSCNSVQQVFDIFAANKNSFTSKHLCQAILVLRDIQKVFNKFYLDDFTKNITEQKYETGIGESHHSVFHVFQRELTSHERFKELLSRINEECDNFDIDEAVCTMLYLQYLGVHLKHKTIQRLISHADKTFRSSPEKQFSYQTLSRYFSSFKFEDSLYSVLILSKALPTVVTHLEKCNDVYSLGQISVCLEIVKDLMNTDLKQLFQNKLVEILSTLNIQTIEETRSLMKILVFLNLNFWSEENVEIIQRLLLLLADYIHMLDIKEIMYIQRVFSNQLEPYIFLDRVQKRAERVMSRCDDAQGEPSLGTLACMAPVATYKQKKYIEKSLLNKLKEPSNLLNTMDTLGTISDLIRFVQTDNSQIHTMFWNRVLVLLQDQPSMGFLIFFSSRYIKRYLFQNNFRNYQFEEFIKKSMWSELDCASPKHLVFYATIILKLSPSYVKTRIPNVLFTKLVDNIDQLCLLSCFVLMDALVVMLNVADSKKVTPQFSLQFTELERRLETRINQILDESEYISALDCFEIFLKQRCKHWQHIYQKLFTKIPPERMSSRLIYAACRHIIIHSEHYTPAHALLDKCVRYCEDNSDVIIGLVVSYVLYSCYLVSYPLHTQHPKFLEIASRILLRDKDSVKRLVLIRSSLALAYYNSLPHSLTEHIFSLNFLEYLDEEMCTTSSQSLTLKIRNDLMELNRAVCLDYAQFGIPWFHQKYVRQLRISAQQNSSYSKFHNDVRDVLVHYVGDPQLVLTNVTSPYGQKIDFVLCLDKLGNPVHSHDALTTTSAHRVKTRLAILLEQNWAKGPSELRRRHLELQGYSVINLYNKQWNALFMGEPKAKHLYLDQIFRQYRPLITSGEPL